MSKPVITVFGATGAQGGGLARALLTDRDRHFAVRAVTRRPDGAAAASSGQRRRRGGAGGSRRRLPACCAPSKVPTARSSSPISGNTCSGEKELAQAHTLAAAAAQAGIRHAIWSTLEDTREFFPADGARMPVLAEALQRPALRCQGRGAPLLRAAARAGHLPVHLRLLGKPDPFRHGPAAPGRWHAGGDIPHRRCAHSVDRRRGHRHRGPRDLPARRRADLRLDRHRRRSPDAAPSWRAQLDVALGEHVHYNAITPDAFRAFGFPGADELGNMWQFKRDFEAAYCARRDLTRARALHPRIANFATWLKANASRIPVAQAA